MEAVDVDDRGRLYLSKELRETYGDRFRIVRLHDGIKLVPRSESAVRGLARTLAPLADLSVAEIRRGMLEQAAKDVRDRKRTAR